MTRNITVSKAELILAQAATLVTVEKLPASDALTRAMQQHKASEQDRDLVQDAFGDALVRCPPGKGTEFHRAIIEHAHRIVQRRQKSNNKISTTVGSLKNKLLVKTTNTERKTKMTENNEATETQTTGRKKKYNIGDEFGLTSDMGLTPSEAGANIEFTFSRKTGKGNIDLAEGTLVTYTGTELVYADKPSSKRMIFRIPAGTRFTQDGEEGTLNADVRCGGVPNHIDSEDEYNVNRRLRAEERAEKQRLKAEAEAAAKAAKAESEAA